MKKEEIFKVLDFWNYWDKKPEKLFLREYYLNKINLLEKSWENLVITWIRRAGKSSILKLKIKELLGKWVEPKQILFVNFEEPKFFWYLNLKLLDEIWETYLYYLEPDLNKKIYVFFDEIQVVEAWEKWVLKFYEKTNIQFFITWSSSKLLSKEFATVLAWRFLQLEVYPLSFKEFLQFKKFYKITKIEIIRQKLKLLKLFEEYLKFWWFPKIALLDDEILKKEELSAYFDTIIIKDIARRYKNSNINEIKKLAYYFLSNNTKLFSINSLKKMDLLAYDTIKKYLSYFQECYLFFEVFKFDYSLKKQLVNPKKIYSIDLWFVNLLWFNFSENIGRNLENLVFIELQRQWKEVYYHKWKKECDFVVYEWWKIVQVIQANYSLQEEKTRKREIAWLLDVMNEYWLKEGLILTYDEEDEFELENRKIIVKPTWKWLL